VIDVNEAQPEVLLDRLRRHLDPDGARITVLGAAFKPGTDDIRESPTLKIVPGLLGARARVVVHDPIALPNARAALGDHGIVYEPDLETALSGADAVLLITAWPEYAALPELLRGTRPWSSTGGGCSPGRAGPLRRCRVPGLNRRPVDQPATARPELPRELRGAVRELGFAQRGQRAVLLRDVDRGQRPGDRQLGISVVDAALEVGV
jgi:hypothetical protein